jgi:hypothetical protein
LNLLWDPCSVGRLPQGLLKLLFNALRIGIIESLPRSM